LENAKIWRGSTGKWEKIPHNIKLFTYNVWLHLRIFFVIKVMVKIKENAYHTDRTRNQVWLYMSTVSNRGIGDIDRLSCLSP
jgi:hypothetical protein